jgi:hypothetical protein
MNQPRRLYTTITWNLHANHQGDFLTVPGRSSALRGGDYNNDGRPDLSCRKPTRRHVLPSYLYRNDGGGTFTRVGRPSFGWQ